MFIISSKNNYAIIEEPNTHLLQGESVHSMLRLKDNVYLCSVFSGSLQLIDLAAKTANLYASKFKGKRSQCLVPLPGFDPETFPLVLVKEWECIVLFNTKLKEYIKIRDVDTTGEDGNGYYSSN